MGTTAASSVDSDLATTAATSQTERSSDRQYDSRAFSFFSNKALTLHNDREVSKLHFWNSGIGIKTHRSTTEGPLTFLAFSSSAAASVTGAASTSGSTAAAFSLAVTKFCQYLF